VKRAADKARVIIGLLGQLAGMGEPLPRPQGPESERPRVERPAKRPTVLPADPAPQNQTQSPPRRACAPVSGCAVPDGEE
jgi:hypothetical protein